MSERKSTFRRKKSIGRRPYIRRGAKYGGRQPPVEPSRILVLDLSDTASVISLDHREEMAVASERVLRRGSHTLGGSKRMDSPKRKIVEIDRQKMAELDIDVGKVIGPRGHRLGKRVNIRRGNKNYIIEDLESITKVDVQDPFELARKRGATLAAEIFSGEEMLSSLKFGELLGISRQAVDKRRKAGELLAMQGATRGFKYPAWQVTGEGQVLAGLKDVLEISGQDDWAAYRVLVSEYPDGSGEPVFEKLRQGQSKPVMNYIKSFLDGDFG